MKNQLSIPAFILFFSISNFSLFGQVFVRTSNEWFADDCCDVLGELNCYTYKYWFGDTVIIDSVSYLTLGSNNTNQFIYAGEYYREENGIVFMKMHINEAEMKIYNFNLDVGEEFEVGNADYNFMIKVLSIDSITLNSGEKRKRLNIESSTNAGVTTFWIEGIGSALSPMNTLYMFSLDCWNNLNCFHEDGSVEFQIGNCLLSQVKSSEPIKRSITSFPNPAKEQVRFAYNDAQSMVGVSVIVTNTEGRTVWQSTDNTNHTDNIVWQTGNVPPGVYFYVVRETNGLMQTGRIVIIKA